MIIRAKKSSSTLATKVAEVRLLGDGAEECDCVFGYEQGADGLTVCPAPAGQSLASVNGLYYVGVHPSFGVTLIADKSGKVTAFKGGQEPYTFASLPQGLPFSFECRNADDEELLVVVSGNVASYYDAKTQTQGSYTLPYSVYGGVLHCGRLFAVDEADEHKIVWSGLRADEWKAGLLGSGYAYLNGDVGKILKLESFADDLLCVCEYGFTVVKGLADVRNFRIAPSQYSVGRGGKIEGGGVCGQRYYFCRSDGLYSFDGESVRSEYSDAKRLSHCGSVRVYGGYVFACCTYVGIKCLMRYDVQNGKATFFGKDCEFPFFADGNAYCVKDNRLYALAVSPNGEGLWRSKKIGGCGRKTLKRLFADADDNVCVTVVCDGVKRTVSGKGEIPVYAAGEDIYLEISGGVPVRGLIAQTEERK